MYRSRTLCNCFNQEKVYNRTSEEMLTSDGALLELMKLAFDKAQHQAGLAHRRLPQQHQFELADFVGYRGAIRPSCSSTAASH